MAKIVKGPKQYVSATIYFIRKDFTEPEPDDTFVISIPKHLYESYKANDNDILMILEYLQGSGDSDIREALLNHEFISDMDHVRMEVCSISRPVTQEERDFLLSNTKKCLYDRLDCILNEFYDDYSIDNTQEFLKEYINSKE